MARTFTAAAPSALNTLADTPGVPAMPSPTTARIARSCEVFDALDLAFGQLARERGAHHALGALGLLARNRAADRMLRAALRDQDDRDALLAQRAEQPMRRARHADHAGALDVDQRDVLDGRDALHRAARKWARRRSACRGSSARTCCGCRSGSSGRWPAPSSADGSPWRRSTRAPWPRCTRAGRSPAHSARGADRPTARRRRRSRCGSRRHRAGSRRSRPRNRCRCGRAWSARHRACAPRNRG